MDDFFHIISRLIIVVPLIVIILALFVKLTSPSFKSFNTAISTPTITPTVLFTATTSAKLDLTGPFNCQVNLKGATLSAFIKDKKISARFDKQNFLLKDECLYLWDLGSFSGEKVCGLGTYVNLAETLLSSNLLDMNSIVGYLNQFGHAQVSLLKNTDDIKSLVNSCKKEKIVDTSVFDLPQNVLFKNKAK